MKNVLIIGCGVVGKNLGAEIIDLKPDYVDKYKDIADLPKKRDIKYDVGFVCVDTPLMEDYSLNIEEVKNAILENDCEIYCLKSTCPVGTVEKLKEETGKRIVFSPEYYGGTKHCNNFKFDFTILGGDKDDCAEIVQLLLPCYDGRHQFRIVEPKLAELVKFMENSFLATKVSFCIQFAEICNTFGLNYDELRELFLLDERVGKSHTFVYKDHPYWDSHCLNKDVPCIAFTQNAPFLQEMVKFNKKMKENYESKGSN